MRAKVACPNKKQTRGVCACVVVARMPEKHAGERKGKAGGKENAAKAVPWQGKGKVGVCVCSGQSFGPGVKAAKNGKRGEKVCVGV